MDNDSINKKIIDTKEGNRLVIIEDIKPNIDKNTKPNIDKDTKPNIDKDTKPNIDIFKDFSSNNKTKTKKDMDKTIPKKEDIDKTIPKKEDKDKTIPKTIKDMEKTIPKKEDTDKTIPKTKTEYKDDNEVQVYYNRKTFKNKENGDWRKRHILWVFWNNNHISELCEKWIYKDGNYAYARFEELRTRSGEVLFTNEHKATLSKEKSKIYIDIDKLKIFKYFSFKAPTPLKTKDILYKINNKISIINETSTMLAEIKVKVKKKIKLIH